MKPIIRNFLSVIRRFKIAVALNILGLSVAFAAFMVIMIQLNYDLNFDKFHKDYDKIFRVERFYQTEANVLFNRPTADIIFESSPHVVASAVTSAWEGIAPFFVEKDGKRDYYEEKSLVVLPSFFDVFTFDFVEGSNNGYIAPKNVFIPLSLSRKLFGNESAVGKQIVHSNWGSQTVMAVYRDLPANSILKNYIYFAMYENENKNNWQNNVYNAYIRVDDASNTVKVLDAIALNAKSKGLLDDDDDVNNAQFGYRLTALPDVHFVTGVSLDETPKASKQTLLILFAIAIVIVVIASINFTNFSTALTPMRIKNINTQRVLGARRNTLRLSIALEAVVVSLLSYFLAIFFFLLFSITPLARLVDADLSISANSLIVGGTAVVALFAGIIAGLYPSFYITSFAPALVLKGSFGLSPKGKRLRNTLIGVQFIASIALIIGASFMYMQNHFMQHLPLGYDKDEMITVNIGRILNSRDAFTNQLKAYSGIEDVTYGNTVLSSRDEYGGVGRRYKDFDNISFGVFPIHYTFLKTMGIEITEGRDFRAEDAGKQSAVFVFNETARKKFDMEIGTSIEKYNDGDAFGGEIIGFISDVKFASLRKEVEPMAFVVLGAVNWGMQSNQAFIKMRAGADKRATMAYIHSTLSEFGPEYMFNVQFYDDVVQRLYEKEIALNLLITLFSLIAIFISIVGVFGLVVFDSECRRKEIGIRKILGASTMSIIIMFNKAYFRILLVCFVIAAPLAWYAITRWLENFAYKTPMYWWVYMLAFLVVGIITAATVTFQNWRVANDNPVNAIKKE